MKSTGALTFLFFMFSATVSRKKKPLQKYQINPQGHCGTDKNRNLLLKNQTHLRASLIKSVYRAFFPIRTFIQERVNYHSLQITFYEPAKTRRLLIIYSSALDELNIYVCIYFMLVRKAGQSWHEETRTN